MASKYPIAGYREVPQMGCALIELKSEVEAGLVKDLLRHVQCGGRPLNVDYASPDVVESFKLLQQSR